MARRSSIEPPAYETIVFASTPSSVFTTSGRRNSSSSADSGASSSRSDCSCPCNCVPTTTTTAKGRDNKQTTTTMQNQTFREKWRAMRDEDRAYRASRVQYISKTEADRITGLERRREQKIKSGKKNIDGQGFGYGFGVGAVYGQRYP